MENSKSLTRLFSAGAYLAMLVSLFKPVRDADVWWHLGSGRYLVENRTIPHVDVFSLTAAGTPWINTYWLFDAALYLGYLAVGLAGVIALHAVLALTALAFQQKSLRESGLGPLAALAAVFVMFFGASPRLEPWEKYASLVSLVFLSALTCSLYRWKRDGWGRSIWVWPAVFCLWANMHRGVTFGLAVAGCFALLASGDRKSVV